MIRLRVVLTVCWEDIALAAYRQVDAPALPRVGDRVEVTNLVGRCEVSFITWQADMQSVDVSLDVPHRPLVDFDRTVASLVEAGWEVDY